MVDLVVPSGNELSARSNEDFEFAKLSSFRVSAGVAESEFCTTIFSSWEFGRRISKLIFDATKSSSGW
tara:strand:- start:282 stop:485 length:204 start_codon:yes stop_codon:yes gene_type:complete